MTERGNDGAKSLSSTGGHEPFCLCGRKGGSIEADKPKYVQLYRWVDTMGGA